MVIEFHGLDMMTTMEGYEFINLTFSKILKNFEIVHIHPNNCCGNAYIYKNITIPRVMEFTFIRKDRISKKSYAKKFPNTLDRKNVDELPDIILPKCWYDINFAE